MRSGTQTPTSSTFEKSSGGMVRQMPSELINPVSKRPPRLLSLRKMRKRTAPCVICGHCSIYVVACNAGSVRASSSNLAKTAHLVMRSNRCDTTGYRGTGIASIMANCAQTKFHRAPFLFEFGLACGHASREQVLLRTEVAPFLIEPKAVIAGLRPKFAVFQTLGRQCRRTEVAGRAGNPNGLS
jgi:hypothetical protein